MAISPTLNHSETLRHHGLSVTAQRLAVLSAVAQHPHAAADTVHEVVSSHIGSVSRQAIYDALSTLSENGIIRRIQPSGSPARYEDRVNDNHHHLICRECNHLVDIDCAVGLRPCLVASDDHGFDIDEAEVIYWGRCSNCRTPSPKSPLTTKNKKSK